jgi:glycosyltransferase involved in cell wall biosynthesis
VARTHLVTQVRNREALLRAGLVEGSDFTAIDSEAVARPVHRLATLLRGGTAKGWTTNTALATLSYYYFEALLWRRFRADLAAGRFDLVHRLTPLTPTTPSRLARRCARTGVPFVLGPLNGGVPWPPGFGDVRRAEREWLAPVRAAYKLLPGHRSMLSHAAAIVVGSLDTWKQLPPRVHARCVYVPENGIDESRFPAPLREPVSRPLRLAFVGRLVPYKGADIALLAAAPLLRENLATFEVVGDGPQRGELERIAAQEGVGAAVTFRGWVEHAQLHRHLARADVLVFPSVREFGGGVVLEAMALGVVPVVVRYGGPAELVTHDTGFLVELGSRDALLDRVASLLRRLVAHPEEVAIRSAPARRRVLEEFTWSAKATRMRAVYDWVLGRRERPPLDPPCGVN